MTSSRLLAFALAAGLALSQARATAVQPSTPTTPGCTQHLLDEPAHSSAAVAGLGADVSAVDAPPGWNAARVKRELLADPSLWVDPCGSLFYADAERPASPAPAVAAPEAATTISPADAFNLHSRPGSLRTIFLDFDGGTVSGTRWNADGLSVSSWVAPAWSTDGDATSFSTSERNGIIEVWQRVADDFAPFDVDVTTADPGPDALARSSAADQTYGSWALITPDTAASAAICDNACGGIAYLDTFDAVGSAAWQPAWIFPHLVSNVPKYMAEAASHEVGHNLSLSHDGLTAASPSGAQAYYRGAGGWGPVMGAPYSQPIIQWSRGEYPFANNRQDDVTLISSAGAPLLGDDVGDTAATAAPLTPGIPRDALITSAADTDWYSFTAEGPVTASATPLDKWPNLDTRLVLTAADGTELASSAPAYSSGTWPGDAAATISGFQLPAPGSYRLRVEGAGNGIPGSDGATNYGSLGPYRVSVNTGLVVTGPASVPALVLGSPTSFQLDAGSGAEPYSWSVAFGSLPPGLSLAGSTVSGTPSVTGTWQVTVRVTDATLATASRDLTLTVVPSVSVASPPPQVAMTADTPATLALLPAGGRAPYTWELASGELPAGLTLTGAAITGTPSAAGTWTAQLRVTDALDQTAVRTLSFTVAPRLTISAPAGAVLLTTGTPASIELTAAGGTAPLTWHVASESLPTGMTLRGPVISGTPTRSATWSTRVIVSDAVGASAYRDAMIEVGVPLQVTGPGSPVTLVAGDSVTIALLAVGGLGPYQWSVAAGSLPPGVALSGSLLTGAPTSAGAWTATVQVRDAAAALAQKSVDFQVAQGSPPTRPSLAAKTVLPAAGKKHPYQHQLTASGGAGRLAWRRTSGKLPAGIKLSGSGLVTGKPTRKGKFAFVVKVTDAAGRSAVTRCTIRVR